MKQIEFTKDFAGFKKGDKSPSGFTSTLMSRLVHVRKVAKYVTAKKEAKSKTKKTDK